MNLKNLLSNIFSIAVLLTLLSFTEASAQATYYVNNSTGSDGYDGLSPTWTGGSNGPKLSLAGAYAAAPGIGGSPNLISVAFTGNPYTEAGPITIAKAVNLTSTGGAVVFTNASLVLNLAAGASLGGPMQFVNLTLTLGQLTGATNLTVSGNVTRTAGSVDGQINYTAGAHNFTYDGGAAITSGGELPAAGNTANFGNLTTVGGATALTLNESKTMNGILTTAGTLNLGGGTLTIAGANAHTIANTVSNGTLAFSMTGATSIDASAGAQAISANITANKTTVGLAILTIDPAGAGTITTLANITASNNASITTNNTGDIGNVTLNGAGTITTVNNGTVGDVLGASGSTGTITLNRSAAGASTANSITQSGLGLISYGGNVNAINVTNNVLLNSTITATNAGVAGLGLITFTDDPVNIGGNVTNSANITGASNAGANPNNAVILFQTDAQAVTITGTVINTSTGNPTLTGGGTADLNARIDFAFGTTADAAADAFAAGGFNNSSAHSTGTNSGLIRFTAAWGDAGNDQVTAGVVSNTSSSTIASNGTIDFNAASTGAMNVTSVSSSGGTGGDILFGRGNFNAGLGTGTITNSRTAAGADINFGAALAASTFTSGTITNSGPSSIGVFHTSTGAVTVNGDLTNSGSGNIDFSSLTTGNATINGTVTNSGAGTTNFSAMTTGLFTARGMNLSAGTILIRGNAAVPTTIGQANQAGSVSLTGGILDFVAANARNFVLQTASITIGGTGQNPTFNNTGGVITMLLSEPIPNVTQVVTIGNANPAWPGDLLVQNNANIPAPVVRFANASPGNLFVLGGQVTFNNGAVLNSVELNGVKIYVGDKNLAISGDFQNTTGYTTVNDGRVVMYGSAVQTVQNLADAAAGAYFGSFEVDNSNGAIPAVIMRTAGPDAVNPIFTDFFYLSLGSVEGVDVEFDRPAPLLSPPYPTIVRNAGSFDAAPVFTSRVNVTYIGGDKATAFEIPVAANRLNDFTVATTTGANPGFGVVTLGGATTCLGTLTVNADQTLLLNNFNFTLGGASAVVNGNVVNSFGGAVEYLVFGAATGTAVTGTGNLPSMQIAAGSVGNTLGGTGIVDFGFGQDNAWGGVGVNLDDFGTKDGNFVYAGGAASSLTVSFTGAGPHFANLTTAAGALFTLGANARMSGDINHVAGTIDVDGFTLTHNGIAPQMTGGALITSNPGFLLFNVANTVFTVNAGPATIDANVNINTEGNFTLAGGNLAITGNLSLLDSPVGAPGATFNINAGLTLTAGGTQVNVASNCSFAAPGAGTGILLLDAVTPPLTYTTTAATTVANLTVADDVILAGGVLGSTLTINGNHAGNEFVHTAGDFNIGTANLVFGTGAAGVDVDYNRAGGTYSGTGFFVWNSNAATGTFTHGPALVLNNLRTTTNLTFISATGVTVNDYLDLDGGIIDHTIAGVGYLTIGDGVGTTIVEVDGTGNLAPGAGNVAATFAPGSLFDYLFTGATSTPNTFTWPTNQANNVTLGLGAAANNVNINPAANKVIGSTLTLTTGNLVWDAGTDISMPLVGQKIIRNVNGALNNDGGFALGTGTFTAPDINIDYTGFAVGPVGYNTGLEYNAPVIVRDVTLLPLVLPNQTMVNINSSRTISGTLTLSSVLTFNAGFTTNFTLAQTIAGTGTVNVIANGAAPFTTVNWNGGLTVNGTYNNNEITNVTGNLAGSGIINNFVGGTLSVTGSATGTFALTNNGIMNLGGMNQTAPGITTLGINSVSNFTGNVTINGLVLPNAAAFANLYDDADGNVETFNLNTAVTNFPIINTTNNLTFTGAVPAGPYLNLNFTGANVQTVGLPGNMNIQNLTMNKGGDQTVTFSGGNITLNPAAVGTANAPGTDPDNVNIPAGLLTLTRGILVIGNITAGPPAVPALLTLNLTVAGGFITNLGYVRNPALVTHYAHVVGRLGVAIPAGTIGRSEWPVGSANPNYRPAAITFTAGNATIAPTTIIVEHIDGTPAGNVNLPLVGGTKFNDPAQTLYIGSKAPYSWKLLATTSLGASQLFDLELQGTNLNRQFETVNDIRIIRRFDGDVSVNGWFLQGNPNNYSNIMQENFPTPGDTIITARNQNSQGGIVQQAAFFTLGIPSQAPIFNAVLVNQAINEGQALNFTYTANDPDVNAPAPVFSLINPPAGATINSSTGAFSWTPDFTQGNSAPTVHTVTARVAKGNDPSSFAETVAQITVNNVNRAPELVNVLPDTSITDGQTLTYTYTATDLDIATDGQTLIFTIVGGPAGATITPGGVLTWTPTFAQAGQTYTIDVQVADNGAPGLVDLTTADVTVTQARQLGDVNGIQDGLQGDGVGSADASEVLKFVVALPSVLNDGVNDAIDQWAADVNQDGQIGALDAAWILFWNVNGAWPNILAKANQVAGDVAFGKLTANEKDNEIIDVPVVINGAANVMSSFISLNIDNKYAELDNVSFTLPEDWVSIHNYVDGKLRIALSGAGSLVNGQIAVISLRVKDKEAKFTINGTVSLNDYLEKSLSDITVKQIPTQFGLSQNYPNPFNPSTTIKYQLAADSKVSLAIYDMLGQKVKTLVNDIREAGYYTVEWNSLNENGQKVTSGIYIYRLEAGDFVKTIKMNLLK
jgi:hypothetical protein